ncbi:MAG: YceD family protein [Methyloceanibacter sp.]|uniref:YceD family protein n=1 Tax=Methyloceanibacter sp. TaxID=1965321 RepID=UPI003D9AC76E
MSRNSDTPPLSRPLRVDEIEYGAESEIVVTENEMAAIAALLDLKTLEDLAFTYRIRSGDSGRLHLIGRLKTRVTQICVVSLDPVETSLDVPIEAAFWPVSLIEALKQNAEDPAGGFNWPEPIADGRIDFGPLIYESLATALDPYPRREGVSFEWSQGAESDRDAETGPFAALGALKRR